MGNWTSTSYMRGVSCISPINVILHMVELDLLFGVVRCICKDLWKDLMLHSITTSD